MDIRFHRRLRGEYFQNGGRACHAAAQQNSKDDLGAAANFVLVTFFSRNITRTNLAILDPCPIWYCWQT